MNINKAFPSKYLKASDLDGEMNVEIEKISFEEVGPQKDRKPVAYFKGVNKGVVLNKTRSNGIVRAAGSEETDEWVGALVVLYPSTTQFQGEEVECIGIRPPKQKKGKGGGTGTELMEKGTDAEVRMGWGPKGDDQPPFDPDFESWLDEQVTERIEQQDRDAMLAETTTCPACGFAMLFRLTDASKPYHEGRFHWWCSEPSCGKRWESIRGELKERVPVDKEIGA